MALPIIENNTDVMNDYINYLELQDLKLSTIMARTWSVVPFFHFVKCKPAGDVTKKDIESFAVYLKRCGKKKSTQRKNLIEVRDFFNWKYPDNDFFENIKLRKEKPDTSEKEYVTSSDVAALLPHCVSQRDRAFIFLLWESAARLGEVLSLNVGDVKPTKHGMLIKVTGKTGTRDIMLIDAVPDVQTWLNIYKEEDTAPLFPITRREGRLQARGAQTLLLKLQQKAGLTNKRLWIHGFRHGRLTELSNQGMTEPQLRLFAGWGNDSAMPSTYIHVKQKDVIAKMLQIKGIVHEEDIQEVKTTKKNCPRCGNDNAFDSLYCRTCSMILDPIKAQEEKEKQFEEMRDYFEGIMNAAYDEVVKEEKPKTTKNKHVVSKK